MNVSLFVTERLLAVDAFALANASAFTAALETLAAMLSEGYRAPVTLITVMYEASLRSGAFREKSVLESMPRGCSALILTAYFHLSIGAPLFINDDLFTQWVIGEDAFSQCRMCGYRFVARPKRCPLCGGEIGGSGCFEAARARAAGSN